MILYLDTSALVKLFVAEPGSDLMHDAMVRAGFRGCHIIGYAEVCAALSRRGHILGLATSEIELRIAELTRSWQAGIDVIGVDWPLVHRAGQLALRYRLRGYDSIHLAAAEALWVRFAGASEFRFAVFDDALANAAESLGMQILADPLD